ncbi:MAG: NUDIX hydrolase [Verrucomicrobiaceae bacterium]|nr:NUDIX hydrolase [Verrucomicrobiaceae bacterium]
MIYFAQKAFVVDSGKLLMVQKSADDPIQPQKWEVPGGRMDEGEDLDSHIKREVFEETGVHVRPGSAFYVWQWNIPSKTDQQKLDTVIAVARIATLNGGDLSAANQVEGDHLAQIKWIPLSQLFEIDLIPNMKPVVAEFLRIRGNNND